MVFRITGPAVGYEVRRTKKGNYVVTLYYSRDPSSVAEKADGLLFTEARFFCSVVPDWLEWVCKDEHVAVCSRDLKYGVIVQVLQK